MATSSVNKKISRYVNGGESFITRDNRIKWWERFDIPRADDDINFLVTAEFAERPDRIAHSVYGRAGFAWIVLQYNTIVDIVEELAVGKRIRLPQSDRVFIDILNNTAGGTFEQTG